MKHQSNYFKQNFASFQSSYDDESYTTHKDRKSLLFEQVKGSVLEIGPGTGVNFLFFKPDIHWTGIEPNPAMHPYLKEAARKNDIKANLVGGTTERIPIEENTFDFVVSTEVLCSVTNLQQSLLEIKRVLKPGGRFLFLEHVVDHDHAFRRTVQQLVPYTPWKFFSDGCHPARDIEKAIKSTGFTEVACTNYMQEGKGVIQAINRPHIIGEATN